MHQKCIRLVVLTSCPPSATVAAVLIPPSLLCHRQQKAYGSDMEVSLRGAPNTELGVRCLSFSSLRSFQRSVIISIFQLTSKNSVAHSFSSHVSPLGKFCWVTSGSLRSLGAASLVGIFVDVLISSFLWFSLLHNFETSILQNFREGLHLWYRFNFGVSYT
jgi:hypothetical protein